MLPSRKHGGALAWGRTAVAGMALIVLALAGCRPASEPAAIPTEGPVRRASTQLDPCAERMHDICGHLLLYCQQTGQLPQSVAELQKAQIGPTVPLVCPVSGQPYVYIPAGLEIKGQEGRLVLFDPAPSHTGMRWGIFVRPPKRGMLLATRVILLPDKLVTDALAAAR